MPDWFSKASQSMGRRPPDAPPATFHLDCPCGNEIDGERRDRYQRALCKSCGESFFILPIDVYPQPIPKSVKAKRRKRKSARRKKVRLKNVKVQVAEPKPVEAAAAATSKAAASEPAAPDFRKRPRRKIITPVRAVMFFMVLVIGGTVYWRATAGAIERAEANYAAASKSAFAAMKQKDFLAAAEEFEKASNALDILQRDDSQARLVRQMNGELTALNGLSNGSLLDMLDEAETAIAAGGASKWQERFRLTYQDTWIVMQTTVTAGIDRTGTLVYAADLPLTVNQKPVVLQANLPAFRTLFSADVAERMTKQAQLPNLPQVQSPPIQLPQPVPPHLPVPEEEPPAQIGSEDSQAGPASTDSATSDPTKPASSLPQSIQMTATGPLPSDVIFAAQLKDCRLNAEDPQSWVIELRPDTAFLWSNFDNFTELGFTPDEFNTADRTKNLLATQAKAIGLEQ